MLKKATLLQGFMAAVLMGSAAAGQDVVSSAELSQIDYYQFWQTHLPLQPEESIREIVLVDAHLYAMTDRAVLYALHADIGTIRWSAKLGGDRARVFRPTHTRSFWGRDVVVVSTSDKIMWLHQDTGELISELNTTFVPSTPAVSDGVRVYVAGMDAMLHCFEWVPHGDGASLTTRWRVQMQDLSVTQPQLVGGGLFFASEDGRVRACNALSKARWWVFNCESAIRGDLHVDSTGVYFGTTDRNIYKVDVASGRGVWRCRTPGMMITAPVLVGDMLYQRIEGDVGIYALRADTGETAWQLANGREFVAAGPDEVYFLSAYGDILGVDPADGAVRTQIFAGQAELVARNLSSAAFYLANRAGALLCAQNKKVPYLRFETIQARHQDTPATLQGSDQQAEARRRQAEKRKSLAELLESPADPEPLGQLD